MRFLSLLVFTRRIGLRRRELVVEGDVYASANSLDSEGACDRHTSRVRHLLRLGRRDALGDFRRVSPGLVGSVPGHVFNVPCSTSLERDEWMRYQIQTRLVRWGEEGSEGQCDRALRQLIEYVSFTRNLILGEYWQVCAEAFEILRNGQSEDFGTTVFRLAVSRVGNEQTGKNWNLIGAVHAHLGFDNRPNGDIHLGFRITIAPDVVRTEVGLQDKVRSDAPYGGCAWSTVAIRADISQCDVTRGCAGPPDRAVMFTPSTAVPPRLCVTSGTSNGWLSGAVGSIAHQKRCSYVVNCFIVWSAERTQGTQVALGLCMVERPVPRRARLRIAILPVEFFGKRNPQVTEIAGFIWHLSRRSVITVI